MSDRSNRFSHCNAQIKSFLPNNVLRNWSLILNILVFLVFTKVHYYFPRFKAFLRNWRAEKIFVRRQTDSQTMWAFLDFWLFWSFRIVPVFFRLFWSRRDVIIFCAKSGVRNQGVTIRHIGIMTVLEKKHDSMFGNKIRSFSFWSSAFQVQKISQVL